MTNTICVVHEQETLNIHKEHRSTSDLTAFFLFIILYRFLFFSNTDAFLIFILLFLCYSFI